MEREYNFIVSRSRVRLWLADLEKQYAENPKEKELAELLAEAESDKVKELKNTNERLLKQIDKLKDKKADMIEAVYRGAKDGMSTLTLPKISKPTPSKNAQNKRRLCAPAIRYTTCEENPGLRQFCS